jgi:hypothetical protein
MLVSFWTIHQNTSTGHIFDDLIYSLCLSVGLGVIG